ncbi:Mitogen-activated protein kinase 17 [Raphanus sativus]|uniref:mitogen-activated protein kinase n=1 Tax=Raphanus sativus TaxID=3726 RepID=A0A6J0LBA6_RAPSA|nr:mitogen-activated protein kinase 17 [Raphanus sativus]KAJ4878028.1 Mitogen-activated protein kinase 17 [Raphanus sativus]
MLEKEFFTEYGEASQYQIQEVVGKGSYGVVASAECPHTGGKVAIKKMTNVFEHVSDAIRILREIKLLRLLKHPDIVEIKHIMLPPCRKEFKDIYVVFELMESDLHHVLKVNDDLTPQHHQFFLYQLLRGLKFMHSAHVFHRDLKPKNILANADCKIKICDLGLARVSFTDSPSAVFWTDYVATRWYRAPELCGSFYSNYTPAIDMWSVGCIFAEMLTGKPLFPGKNVVHQLELVTDLLGTPSPITLSRIRNEKARKYLSNMRRKEAVPFTHKFPNVDPVALKLLQRLVAFDPKDRPSAEEALADPYFQGLANVDYEPSRQPISKLEFEFERRKLTRDDVRELMYREILEYHPQMLQEYLQGEENINSHFLYPSGVDQFKQEFARLEEHDEDEEERNSPSIQRKYTSLPRERVCSSDDEGGDSVHAQTSSASVVFTPPQTTSTATRLSSQKTTQIDKAKAAATPVKRSACLVRSDSICASRSVGVSSAVS